MAGATIVVLDGDETGQELLEAALAVLDPEVIGLPVELERFDLSLENRRRTANAVCTEAAAAMRVAGLGLKAATITPEGADDVGSPNRLIREGIDGTVIVRTGRRIPGVTPIAGIHHPITVCRMAVGDAYGAEQWREPSAGDELAFRTERISRRVCRAVAEHAFRIAAAGDDGPPARVYGGPKWTVSPVYEGMLKEEMDAAAERHPEVGYEPVLIDATYAGLVGGAATGPLVIPTLNRDGDLLSDLVMPMFGSIAGAESILLSLDDDLRPAVAMAEAPHAQPTFSELLAQGELALGEREYATAVAAFRKAASLVGRIRGDTDHRFAVLDGHRRSGLERVGCCGRRCDPFIGRFDGLSLRGHGFSCNAIG